MDAKRPESLVDYNFAVILSLKKLCYQSKMFNLLKMIFQFFIFDFKRTVSTISSEPATKMAMPDLQWYP